MRVNQAALAAAMHHRPDRFSYARLARYAGCSKGFVSHLVTGRKTTCRPELAERIAEALAVPLQLLFVPNLPPTERQTDSNEAA